MSTRSLIAIEDMETGKVRSIYCHFDGYLDGVGKTLVQHYASAARVEELIALGNISTLGEHIGEKHDFDYHDRFYAKHRGDYDVMYADPEFNLLRATVNAYGRDRGEDDTEATEHDSSTDYFESGGDSWAEYLYLYRQGVWFYAEPGGAAGPFLVSAGDPNAEGEEIWRNVAGMLDLGEKPRSYLIDPDVSVVRV